MPLKELLCRMCGHTWETVMSFSDPVEPCPHCDAERVDILPSVMGGYKIKGNNSASTRPKGSGSRPKGAK